MYKLFMPKGGLFVRKGREKKTVAAPVELATNAVIGSLIALGLTLVLLLIASGLVVSGRLPEGLMRGSVVILLFLTSMIGAFIAILRNRTRALIVGLCEGAILYAITLVFGAFSPGATFFGELSLFLLLAAISGGLFAGIVCNRPKKRRI